MATVNAASGTFSAIQAAADAASDGDIVLVPNGTHTFGNGQVTTDKGIHITGNGAGVCTITRSNVSPDAMFRVDPSPNGPFEFSGITLEGHGPQGESDHGIVLRGKHRGFKIHDNAINRFGRGGISIQGYAGPTPGNAHGVIYSNTFEENGRLKPDGSGEHDFYCIEIYGDPNSDDPVALGTDQAVYVEDNEFTRNNLDCASNNNSRYVFRHNLTTERMESGGESVDAHGQGSWPEGSFSFEIYENELNGGGQTAFMTIGIRGGQGVIFNNAITDANAAIGCHLETAYYRDVASVQDFQTHIHDLYIWNNTEDGNPVGLVFKLLPHQPELPQLVVEGEHYFEVEKPGYTPFTYPHPLRGLPAEEEPAEPTRGVYFDGTNDHLRLDAGLTGAADGKQGTVAGWFKPDDFSTGSLQFLIRLGSPANVALLFLDAVGDLNVWAKNPSQAEIMKLRLPVDSFTASEWNHFLFSWDLSDVSKRHGYANDVEALTVDLWTDDTIDYTVNTWGIGASSGGSSKYGGALHDLALWADYTDVSVTATRRRFVGAGAETSVSLGVDGSLPTGNQPIIFLSGETAAWPTNKGTGGGFTLDGTLGDAIIGVPPLSVVVAAPHPASLSFGLPVPALNAGAAAVSVGIGPASLSFSALDLSLAAIPTEVQDVVSRLSHGRGCVMGKSVHAGREGVGGRGVSA